MKPSCVPQEAAGLSKRRVLRVLDDSADLQGVVRLESRIAALKLDAERAMQRAQTVHTKRQVRSRGGLGGGGGVCGGCAAASGLLCQPCVSPPLTAPAPTRPAWLERGVGAERAERRAMRVV